MDRKLALHSLLSEFACSWRAADNHSKEMDVDYEIVPIRVTSRRDGWTDINFRLADVSEERALTALIVTTLIIHTIIYSIINTEDSRIYVHI